MNLRPSAPKAPDRDSEALGFQAITYLLRIIARLVRTNYDLFVGNIFFLFMGKSFFAASWEKEFKTDVRSIEKGSGLTVSCNK